MADTGLDIIENKLPIAPKAANTPRTILAQFLCFHKFNESMNAKIPQTIATIAVTINIAPTKALDISPCPIDDKYVAKNVPPNNIAIPAITEHAAPIYPRMAIILTHNSAVFLSILFLPPFTSFLSALLIL